MIKGTYSEIMEHFGVNNQQRKLQEEVFELQEAITKFENGVGDIHEIEEEIVDVHILINQLLEYYEVEPMDYLLLTQSKLHRTLERIESGYYENNFK
jgi:NTP pyrophosphatase (non-canonical NTP hydrolase)